MQKTTLKTLAMSLVLTGTTGVLFAEGLVEKKSREHGRTGYELPKSFRPVPVMHQTDEGDAAMADRAATYTGAKAAVKQAPSKAPTATSIPLSAVVLSSKQWPSYNANVGVYSLPTSGVPTKLEAEHTDSRMYANGGAVYADGKLIVNSFVVYDGATVLPSTYIYNAETWEMEGVADGDLSSQGTCMSYDANTENIYGCFYSLQGTVMNFGVLDPKAGKSTTIKKLNSAWSGCAVSPKGVLYAIEMSGKLYTVDKTTGDMTLVGETGLKPAYLSAATFDPYSGKLYYVYTPGIDKSALYEIDTETAKATLIYDLPGGEQVAGLWVPQLTSSMEAPAAPENLAVEFDGPSLSGKITFTAPTMAFDGSPISGELGYTVRINGVDFATGTVEAGAEASANVSVEKAGMYDFTVVASNDKGNGAKAKLTCFVGADTPAAVKNVVLKEEDGKFIVTWDALEHGSNGGYIDTDALTYTVTRYPGEVKVADNYKETTFTEDIPEGDKVVPYYYTVYATVGETVTNPTSSNKVVTGAFIPPYLETFDYGQNKKEDTDDRVAAFNIVDADEDGKTWGYYWMAGYNDGVMNCNYSSLNPKNDWLITPPIYLEAGKQYEFAFDASNYGDPERVEAYFGKENTVEAMNTRLIEPTDITNQNPEKRRLNAYVVPEESGVYYFGIHAISDKYKFYLFVDDVEVSAPRSADTPVAVGNLAVTPDFGGALSAKVSFTAPSQAASGAYIDKLDKIEISRDDKLIATLTDNIIPGRPVVYLDEDPALTMGKHTYKVVPYNADGAGNPAEITVHVGPNVPLPPVSVTAEITEDVGEVVISWVPSEVDYDGNKLNQALVKYTILTTDRRGNQIEVATGISETEYAYTAVPANEEQRIMNFAVIAYTDAGSTGLTVSNLVAVGKAYEMPFEESFPNNAPSHGACGMTQYDAEEYSYWGYYNDASFENSQTYVGSQDGDNGFVGYQAKAMNGKSGFRTGRIAINEGKHPTFSFWHYVTHIDDTNEINVLAITADGEEKTIKTFHGYEDILKVGDWEEITVPLDEFAGQEICLEINVVCNGMSREFFDNFLVYNVLDNNLMAKEIQAATLQNAGSTNPFNVLVVNYGTEKAESYTVELYRDGELVGTADGKALLPGESAKVRFNQSFSMLENDEVEFHAVVKYDKDENAVDDKTPTLVCTVVFPDYPVPANLKAEKTSEGVKLGWEEVADTHVTPVAMTDNFESYTSWEREKVGEWTLYDGDGHKPGMFENFFFPFGYTPGSFFVFDNGDSEVIPVGYEKGFEAYSGHKFMTAVYPYGDTGTTLDDWMISPELTGGAQTVSLYARSYSPAALETFEMLVSDKGTDVKDFELISTHRNVPTAWTLFTAELPAGSKYFAIRCISVNKFLFFVDDVTMTTKNGPINLAKLQGYNVYRGKDKLNAEPVSDLTYLENAAPAEEGYRVTAVFDKGESRASNVAKVDLSGIGGMAVQSLKVYTKDSAICVANVAGEEVSIFSIDGHAVYNGVPASTLKVSVAPGVYMVKAGKATAKVIVK
ncbi:MAG: choice-of-anchor J domain-containing protein [Muribaculaceae bacterium]|nr:choice-of-anchor J domain-containing protein [Muribaculaceae bacterium]